jgi:hypothetical protein
MLPDSLLHEFGHANTLRRGLGLRLPVELVIQTERRLHDRNLSRLTAAVKGTDSYPFGPVYSDGGLTLRVQDISYAAGPPLPTIASNTPVNTLPSRLICTQMRYLPGWGNAYGKETTLAAACCAWTA